jgi:hypothetical protein
MSEGEILEKAIQKAIEGGWLADRVPKTVSKIQIILIENNVISVKWTSLGDYLFTSEHVSVFNHDFAIALWGERVYVDVGYRDVNKAWQTTDNVPKWQYHLQQMVIANDPIKYLGENI